MTETNKLTPQERLELYLKRKKELYQKASREGWLDTERYEESEEKLWNTIIKGEKNIRN